jgi:thiol:disulfide interchange protein
VFAGLGLGLALPFLLLAFVPALRKRLPRPGPWMARLQRILAVPMALSAAAALWLLGRQGGQEALWLGLGAAFLLAFLLLAAGQVQRRGRRAWAVGAAAVMASVAALALLPAAAPAGARTVAGADRWSEARVAAAVREGRPVFVYFTADWCLSCKVNETSSIGRDSVREAFREAGVEVLVADWTNGDPAVTRFLEDRGRAAIPLYLWYAPGRAQAEELPQVLTPGMLVERARAASAAVPAKLGTPD